MSSCTAAAYSALARRPSQSETARAWADADALRAESNTAEGKDRYLLAGLAQAAEQRGLGLAADQIHQFEHPRVLGGEVSPDNLGVIGFVVGLNIAGQIHEQVRDAPPGTPVSGITIA